MYEGGKVHAGAVDDIGVKMCTPEQRLTVSNVLLGYED